MLRFAVAPLPHAFVRSNRARTQRLHHHLLRIAPPPPVWARDCHLSGITPTQRVVPSRSELLLPRRVQCAHAIPLVSCPSSALGRRRRLHGRIAPCGGRSRWTLRSHPRKFPKNTFSICFFFCFSGPTLACSF